jgi:hypothetical protein
MKGTIAERVALVRTDGSKVRLRPLYPDDLAKVVNRQLRLLANPAQLRHRAMLSQNEGVRWLRSAMAWEAQMEYWRAKSPRKP